MKNAKLPHISVFGFMILLAGCFNAVSVMPPNHREENTVSQPFMIDVYVGQEARSVAGGSADQIQDGLYNFIQLIVLNDAGNIIAYDESRKEKSADSITALKIANIPYGQTYKFLLLFGNWERDIIADKTDSSDSNSIILGYKENVYPVLLAAGYKEQLVTGSGKISIPMWPLVIDTVFQAQNPPLSQVQPTIGQPVDLLQSVSWKVKWNIGRDSSGSGNGLMSLLEAHSTKELPITARKYIVDEVEKSSSTDGTASYTLEFSLDGYNKITDIGVPYPVNFYLEYVPFNKTSAAAWSDYAKNSKFDLAKSAPKWIIRNGLNNMLQNADTDFSKTGNPAGGEDYKSFNGNGGVGFKTKEHLGFTDENPKDGFPDGAEDSNNDGFPDNTGTAKTGDLILYDGNFIGPVGEQKVNIAFKTAGYSGNAAVYYGITPPGECSRTNPLPYNMFTGTLGDSFSAGVHNNIPITLPSVTEHDIWLVFMKDGKISNRIAINTTKPSNPSFPYEDGYYVSAKGNDNNRGSYHDPFYTLAKGIAVASRNNKPVIVIGTLDSRHSGINDADSTFVVYLYSVTIKGHPGSNATLFASNGKRVLFSMGSRVVLENITLTRGNGLEEGTGIYVSAGTLILKKGAVVTGNGDGSKKSPGKTKRGGGVFVAKIASFELDGGEISNNWTGADTLDGGGGGIYIEGTAYFRSGLISNNYSFNDGGGVVVGGDRTVGGGWTGELYMYNGTEVSDNEAADDGGGIKVDYKGRFHMHGGKIVQNTCAHYGGGLRLEAGTVDIRTGSLISGSDRSDQNRAGWGGHAYCRLGPQKHDSTITYAFSDSF